MVSRARVVMLLLSFLLVNPLARAQAPQSSSQGNAEIAALAGKVLSPQGQPLSGIHVELDDANTAVPVTSTYTQQDGTFELYNIPKGDYEVVAESADCEISNPVVLDKERPSLELQLPNRTSGPAPLDATTSVARMLVPSKAQKYYDQAFKNFNAGKYDKAQKQLDAALMIDEDFPDALTLRGLVELNKQNIPIGQQYLERAIKADPSNSAAYIALAAVYNHQGRFDDAMHASEKGLSLAPRVWQAYVEMAKASIARSMYQSGLKFIRQAERLGGNTYAEVHLVKAYALIPLKLYKEAKYELQVSIAREHHGQVADQAKSMLAKLDAAEVAEVTKQR
jgi:tetratricopeptide (TPR) repeat protein